MASSASTQGILLNYAKALLCAGTAFILLSIMNPDGAASSAYLLFLAATAVAAHTSGFWPSLLTLSLGFVLTQLHFLQPDYQLHLRSASDWINAFAYAGVGLALAWYGKRKAAPTTPEDRALQQNGDDVNPEIVAGTGREIDAFVYAVSHDLRTPMRAIKGFALALREDYEAVLDAEGKDYTRRIVEATGRLEQMLEALLNFSRIGRGETAREKIELEEYLPKLSQQWNTAVRAQGAQLEIARPLPAVIANPNLLEQSLNQLLSNALKFVADETAPRISVSAEESDSIVRIKVSDNGIGIEEKYFPKLFQVFQRFNPSDKYPGLGMGLAICHKAAEKMGGKVGAQSKPGGGSCFWIELPKSS
jgi:signal transduction histidine kinase